MIWGCLGKFPEPISTNCCFECEFGVPKGRFCLWWVDLIRRFLSWCDAIYSLERLIMYLVSYSRQRVLSCYASSHSYPRPILCTYPVFLVANEKSTKENVRRIDDGSDGGKSFASKSTRFVEQHHVVCEWLYLKESFQQQTPNVLSTSDDSISIIKAEIYNGASWAATIEPSKTEI